MYASCRDCQLLYLSERSPRLSIIALPLAMENHSHSALSLFMRSGEGNLSHAVTASSFGVSPVMAASAENLPAKLEELSS